MDDDSVYGSFGFEGSWDSAPDIWEHQGVALTVEELRRALSRVPGELPVNVSVYDGSRTATLLVPVEVGFTGEAEIPDAVVITASPLA